VNIPARYPLIEAATAVLFLLCFLQYGLTLAGVGGAVLCWLLLGLAATDAETLLLPDALTLPGIILGIVFTGINGPAIFSWKLAAWSAFAAVCGAAFILLIRGVYWLARRREGIGLGDAKLLAMIATWLGIQLTGLVVFLAVVIAALYGLALLILRSRSGRRNGLALRIPLGAFLCGAGIFVLFRGSPVLAWYLRFFR
jgi:leader peptidase (prepilin peptidase)/N-methyltransferase